MRGKGCFHQQIILLLTNDPKDECQLQKTEIIDEAMFTDQILR